MTAHFVLHNIPAAGRSDATRTIAAALRPTVDAVWVKPSAER